MTTTVTNNASQYTEDAADAIVHRMTNGKTKLNASAEKLKSWPLWAHACESLRFAGQDSDPWGDRRDIAQRAFEVSAEGVSARPADFPNILANAANKFLDVVELDEEYSYDKISAVLSGELNDFKPASLINRSTVQELDEVRDAEAFKQAGLAEEMLSYITLRRFGNSFGLTPVLAADDDLDAFSEGLIGLAEAWETTQNRLVVGLLTSNENLLDGFALFADRDDIGSATNNNDRGSGNPPSDTEWSAMEVLYSGIGGIGTEQRVRGNLNVALVPTGSTLHEARRTFAPLGTLPESKVAQTDANINIFRGTVGTVPESDLHSDSSAKWYGFRNPTSVKTATIVRAYSKGYGQKGKRQKWFDFSTKVWFFSLEGRIAAGVKNWRYAVRNAGTGA